MEQAQILQQQMHDKLIVISSTSVPVIPNGSAIEYEEDFGNELSMAVNFLRSGCPAVQTPLLYYSMDDEKNVLSALEKMKKFLNKLSTPSEVLLATYDKNIITVTRHKK